ncbi:MFS transporter [Pseudonocardia sp. RS11V-5]|uniref:MFS transporter n=1 Tax=Pseudonocardia terrae TaxID=2905831 RepID=UPI001E3EE44A|nr:MFS transporter [Pseudonocardia terrae]MCE3555695.1 MFS transporter [Pseudonocardia terrae]
MLVPDGSTTPQRRAVEADPAHAALDGRPRPAAALAAALLGFFVITLDAVIVNVALPSIRADLGGGVSGLQWVVDGYTLVFAALLLSAGSLSDRIGAGRAFGLGLVVFVLASTACGLAPSLGALVVSRLVQGSAAAVMMPSAMALLREAFPEPGPRARALAIWAMGGAVASSAGPVLGGLLDAVDWRLIFLVNLPAGAVALVLLARTPRSPRRPAAFDRLGQLSVVLAMGGLTYGAIEAGAVGFAAPQVSVAFAVAVAAAAVFVVVQRRGAHPMVPAELFRSHPVVLSVLIGFAFMIGYYGLPFVFSLYLQQARGLSSLATGVVFLPMMLIGLVLTPFTARLGERFGRPVLIGTGLAAMAAGSLALALMPATAPPWALGLLLILVGIGGPLVMPPTMAVLLDHTPPHRAGTAGGVFNTSRQLGGALAVAVFGGLLADPDTLVAGVRTSLLITAGIAAVTAAGARLLRSRPIPSTPVKETS